MGIELAEHAVDTFERALVSHSKRRVPKQAIWTAFASAFPTRPQGAEERYWLLEALNQLVARRVIRLPSEHGAQWDRTSNPVIPTTVCVLRVRSRPSSEWRTFPWHPALQWIPELSHITRNQQQFLQRVNDGLMHGAFTIPAPIKYRSLQLTGDEKQLERLRTTALFAPGRLSTDLLGCLSDSLPLAWERVSTGQAMLVFENSGPFYLATKTLRKLPNSPYGFVAFGGGAAFKRSIHHVNAIGQQIDRIEYVGDLDLSGLQIALAITRAAEEASLPRVTPATGLHQAMLASAQKLGRPLGWKNAKSKWSPKNEPLIDWLPADVRQDALRILREGNRVPEETLGPKEMTEVWATKAQ